MKISFNHFQIFFLAENFVWDFPGSHFFGTGGSFFTGQLLEFG